MASTDLKEALREVLCEITEVDEIPDETPFADLGIDSMMAIEIVAEIERTYKISIPEDELANLTTLNKVHEAVSRRLPQNAPA